MLTILRCRLLMGIVLALGPSAGLAQDAVCPGGAITLDVSFAATPHVHISLGSHEGNFLIDTSATASSVDARTFGLAPGSTTRIDGSSFPTITGGQFAVYDWSHMAAPLGGLAGVVGTDFLSLRLAKFHYRAPQSYLAVSRQRCSAHLG